MDNKIIIQNNRNKYSTLKFDKFLEEIEKSNIEDRKLYVEDEEEEIKELSKEFAIYCKKIEYDKFEMKSKQFHNNRTLVGTIEIEKKNNVLSKEDYVKLISTLNKGQFKYLYNLIHLFKIDETPI